MSKEPAPATPTRLWDISPRIDPTLAVFPGDTPPAREVLLDMHNGAPLTLSTVRTTVHAGAHADAESHYIKDGLTIERMPVELYVGLCVVVDVSAEIDPEPSRRGPRLTRADADRLRLFERLADAINNHRDNDARADDADTRVLLKTGTQPDKRVFNNDFQGLGPDLIERLADQGSRLIGVDTPSVDTADSKDLPAHAACARRGVSILEGLVLDGVPLLDGARVYELIAPPLPLAGFDASPVRALLRSPA